MPIVIGLGDENAWNDPLNVYGGKPVEAETSKPTISGRDYEDVVNTVIAEAAGEGDDGMAAVASVIRNRADKRGKSPAEIVREPKQFTGYEAPGPDAVKAMQDPQMRARAASIVDRVLAGELPDVTGGADHYHADYVQPDWASKMPQTAKVGRHIFYRDGERGGQKASAYAPGLDVGTASDPFAAVLRGDAGRQVLSPLKDQPAGNDVLLSKLQPGKPASYIADLHDDMRSGLTTMFTEAPNFVRDGLDILSGARTPEKQAQIIADNAGKYGFSRRAWEADVEAMGPVEAGKKWRPTFRELGVTKNIGMPGGSNHQHGTATDLGWKGGPFSSAPKEVRDWVHTNAGNYGLAFPMAHEPWHIETANARAGGNAKQAQGKTIVVDGAFKTSDPMGLMAGGNPFEAIASQQQAATDQTEADTADGFEQSRIAAENERHNAEVQKAAAADPSRYELVDEAAAQDWQKTWNAENQSSGRAGDFVRNFGIGAAQTSQSISNLNELLISKLPGGDWINEKLNSIERWMGGGKTVAEARKKGIERQAASRSEEGKAAAEKTVFQKDSWALGDALSDPDWYLMQIAQSAPSTIATMAPSGLLARGAFTAAMASGAGEVAAAGAAAKMATVAGGVTEGILGGAQSALSIKEKIAAIPRDQLLQSDAVKQLIADGKTEDEAIRAVSDDAQVQGLVTAGVATGIFGGMGDRAMAQIIGEGIGGGIARRVATGAVKGAVGEGVFEEMPQNVAQTVAENAAMRGVKPDQQLFEGGAEAAASGLAAGAAMGSGMGAVGGAMSPRAPGASDMSPAPDAEPPMPAAPEPKGPVGRAVQHAEQQIAARAAPAPGPEQGSALPEVGATVRVDADGIAPFMGQIEGYDGSEAVVIDNGSGEVYQIPIENLTRIAPAIGQAATPDAGPQPINDSIPEYSSDPALEPMPPRGTDIQTEPLPPASEQKPATERFPSAPLPGERVIVDDPNGGRFPAKVRSYEEGATEALVVTDDGKELQVPVASLAVSKLTDKQVEAQELKRNPPVDRSEERAAAGPNSRAVSGRTVVLPDDRHARLYDLGRDRTLTKRTLGASQLDLGGVNNPELQALATEFKVTPQAIEAMADDYRYRVERAAKSATSDMPQRVAPVNERRLMQWQREAAKAAPESHAQEQTAGMWWDAELTEMDRKRILAEAGVKRSEKMMWAGFTPGIRAKLEPFRVKQVDEPNDQVDGMSASVGDNASAVDTAAHEAATSPSNDTPEPTQAQKEAGNYKLGHLRIGGLDISVENPAGSERKGVDPSGKPWSVEMKSHYGYIKGTVGKDKDHIDVFLRPGTETLSDDSPVFVVDQQSEKGSFDEHKVMLGFESEDAAKAAYLENYTAGWTGLRSITPTTLGAFKQWTAQGDTTKPFAPKAPPTADPYDEVHRRMGVRVSPKDFVSDVANKKLQTAAVIDPRGKLWVLKPTTNPAGDHAEFFGELIGRDLVPFDKTGYVTVTSYSGQIGATSDGPMSVAQSSTVNAIRSAAERYGVNYTGEQPDAAAGTAVRVDNDRAASAEPAEQNRTDAEEAQNGPSDVAEKRRRGGAGSPVASSRKDVAPATRNADTDTALTPAFDASKYPWNDVWGSDAEAISDALSRLSSTNGGDQPLVDLIRSGASDGELLNFIGTRWGIGGAGGNRYMVETSAGPTVTVILEKDDGKKRVVLKGPKLAKALREEFKVSLDEMRAKAEGAQEKPKAKPEVSENKIFTSDAAERARALLRSKLNQLNSGIDPEIMQAGITLAGYHIERGARTFAAYAGAMLADLGEVARPYLKSWYMGVKYDPRATAFDGMSSAAEVDAADVNAIGGNDEPAELEDDGAGALEAEPAGAVPPVEGGRKAGSRTGSGGGADIPRGDAARGERGEPRRRVADDEGAVSPSASKPGASGSSKPDATGPRRDARRAEDNAGEVGTSGRQRSERSTDRPADTRADASSAPPPIENITDKLKNVQSAAVPAQKQAADFAISADDQIGQGGAKTKFANNVAAIRLLRTLTDEQRPATRDEQATLAKWVGWGGLREAFGRDDGSVSKGWEKQAAELRDLLTPEEYRAAEASTRNAHYTAPEVASAIWSIAQRLGFRGGQVLEPSVGVGNFIGLMPGEVRSGSRVTGVELDHITGGIAKHLYPGANIQAPVGFETFSMPDGYFDLAIGNPPFGSERLYDKGRPHLRKMAIHNFFFAKSIEGLKPGGVLAMVVTNRFLDNGSMVTRQLISKQADLIGAIRLPNTAFLKNAGTEVTTDIVLFQKRAPGTEPASNAWLETVDYRGADGKPVPLNRYFIDNPQMMLGEFGAYGTMYGPDEPALIAPKGQDLPAELEKAINRLPSGIMSAPGAKPVIAEKVAEGVEDVHVGSLFLADGQVHQRMPDSLGQPQSKPVEFPNEKAKERVSGMVRVRDVFARLRRAQIDENASEKQVENLRAMLNKAYDAFVSKHGPINADGNKRLFRDDPTWPQISALENNFDKGISDAVAKTTGEKARAPSAEKAPIFRKRTQEPYHPPIHAETAKDALAQTLNERGRVDMKYMQSLYGKGEEDITSELGPLLFKTPSGAHEVADAYLSGNVKAKLAEAERAAETDPDFRRNIAALRDVIPADIEPVDIDVKPGAPWVPGKHVADFINHITESRGATAHYSKMQGAWALDIPHAAATAETLWGTGRASVGQIVTAALNGKSAQVFNRDANGNAVIDQAATDAANEKVERVKTEWQRWLWDNDARRDELARLYNDTFNTDVVRVYDGEHLTLPGKVSDDIITLRPHQKSFVWRTLQSSVALADHTVGAGKTFALIASVMEKRRTGQAKKPLLTVPNHLVGQWAADFVKLYPGAKVLAATKRDFERENRKRLMARITTGDWDAVIIAHSQFGLIGVAPESEAKFIEQQIVDMEASIRDMRQQTGEKSRNVNQLAKQRQNLETKLKTLLDAGRKDDGLYFDDLGVDALYVDEFHEFKNLPFVTGMQRVAGLGNPAGSKKATDMYLKIQQVIERTGGNIVVATGTPLSNTMAEMYTLQRYLSPKVLTRLGIAHFDAWARVFGDVVTDWELSPSGQYKLNTRFARFVNIPELMTQYLSFADVISNDDIKAQLAAQGKTLPLPKIKGGKPTNITVERSPDQASYIGEGSMGADGALSFPAGSLVYRAENLPKKAEKGADNMLKVMSDARKAALDMRLIDPGYGDYSGSKVNRAADEMKRIYDGWGAEKGAQLVFIDLSTPKKAKAKEEAALRALIKRADDGDEAAQEKLDAMSPDEFLALESPFSVYDDLRDKLIERGVPAAEIAFIHDANTELQKEELFGKVRSGRIRFLFGSTAKMGAGTNVQNRLVALHHLDAPWRPSDLEQRDGRIVRQGNELYAADPTGFEVEILRYATKNTLDARQRQGIEAKARFIGQIRKGDVKTRVIEDIAGEAANAAEMKAAASGNPLILEEMDTRRRLRQLEAQATEHEREQHRIKAKMRDVDAERTLIEGRADAVAVDAASAAALAAKPFSAVVAGETVEKPKEFGAALLAAMRNAIVDGTENQKIGSYGDFQLSIEHNYQSNFTVIIDGAREHNVTVSDAGEQDATGLAMQIINTVKRLQNVPVLDSERAAELTKQAPALEKQLGPWAGVQELSDTAAKHRRLIDALKPKAKPAAGVAPATGTTDTPDMLPSNKDKRPDPLMTGTGNNFRSLKAPPVQPGQSLLDWATKAVLAKGRADGNEYLVAVEDDGSLIEHGTTSDRRNVGLSLKLERAMLNPDRQIAIFHNHPANGPISRQDMTQLAYPGVYSVWALGHDGKNTRVSLAAGARDALGLKNAEPATVIAKMSDLARALTIAEGKLRDGIQNLVNDRVITGDQASTAHLESMPLVAARAGLIDYQTNEPYDVGQVPRLDSLIDDAALILSGALFNERNAKKIADARVRGPAKSVRHIAELERLAGGYQQVAAQQSGSSALHEGSAGDYSAKAAGTVTRERITRELSGRLTDIQPALLKAIPLNYFTELARPNMKAVGDYLRVKRLMDAFRGEKHAAADEVAGDWIKYARLGLLGKDKTRAQALSDLMHQSTIYGIDPSQTDEETTQKFYYEVLRKKYMALSPAGRALYQRVRDAYKAQAEELDQILLDNVRKAQQIAQDRAADRYKRTLQKIRDAGLSPLDRRRAEEDAESAYKAEKTKSTWAAKARMTKMRIAFESTRVQPPYFPLGRFGRYFVTLRNADGSVASFSKFEKAADRDRFAGEVAAQYADFKIEKGVMEQGSDLRRAMDPRMVAEIETMLGDAGVGNDVMDMIWQRYLETMPDLSTRKRFIHRKGTAGYDKDALRVFSSHMFHAAHQMAKVKFGLELQELVNQTTEQAKEADDQTRAMTLANELSKRHDWVMNPTGSKVAQTMTSAAFVWFMAASPASAAVNMAQTYMMGVPILGAKFGGALNAARALVATSYVKDADLKSDEQSALDAFMSSGLIDRTQSHDLAGVGETGVDYTPLRARIMGVLSWAFHKAEVWNRRTVALAAYRLAREAGQDYLTAVDTAHELTWKTHFDYSNSSRPALMQNDFAKVALVFRQYNINMLYRVFRDVQQSIAGESAQAKREARFQLAGVIGMMTLVGGLTGTFGFNLAMTLAGMVFGDDDDPIDFAEGFKADVVNILGPELGGILLNGAPGHYLGIDLSSRIGMPDLWWRSPAQELQGKDEYMYWVSQSLGATVSLGEQLFRGAELISEGDVARGVEILAPKFVRDLMKSYRYANEGLTTIRGDEMMTPERIGWHGVVAQALGFTPAAVSETWERNSAMKNAETKLMDERQRLVNKWAMAAMDGDKAGVEEATKAISKWNAVPIHQPVAIKKETLQRSIKTRAANDAKRQDGTLIKNEILGRRLRDAMAERVY